MGVTYTIQDIKESLMTTPAEIKETLSRSVCGGWDRGFLESILEQLEKDRTLSAKQRQILGKVLARNTVEHQAMHENWGSTYEEQYKDAAHRLARYHINQPYYREMAVDILANRIPERSRFLRMYDNKYSKRVLRESEREPRYEMGAHLVPRASFSSYKSVEFPSDLTWNTQHGIIESFQKRGGFVISIMDDIRSAAKGAKRYKLLPIGETTPIIVEERYLKVGKK